MRIGAVDAGQSGTRGVVIEPDGARRAIHEAAGVRHLARPDSPAETGLRVLEALGPDPGALDALGVGISGFDQDRTLTERVSTTIRAGLTVDRIALTSDAVTSFLGALGTRAGVVVAGGTGLVCLAADGTGRWAWVDGAGYLLGDEGGGSWIGRRGLREAVRVADGRGGSLALADLAERRFGPLARLPSVIYAADHPAAVLASFAPDVGRAAAAGDEAAIGIWTDAAAAIARTIGAAIGRALSGADRVTVACTGSLFTADLPLVGLVAATLRRERDDVEIAAPAGGSIEGAITLAREPGAAVLFPGLVHITQSAIGAAR